MSYAELSGVNLSDANLSGGHCPLRRSLRLAPKLVTRRSASFFTDVSKTRLINTMPGEKNDQYSRNLAREVGSVAATRVSVPAMDSDAPIGSARNVHTIFT